MSTEYRRGIPSREHIEAATRLGLEWQRKGYQHVSMFALRGDEIYSDFASPPRLEDLTPVRGYEREQDYRPIRPDGTPVDWEVLDQEVARVGQQGPERRVAERIRGQTQAPTVTAAQPEPRRFADVRPDRHGWQWWRDLTTGDCFTIRDGVYVRRFDVIDPWLVLDLSAWLDRTVIPTDEQGNPVSWESIGQTRTSFTNAPPPTETQRQALAAQIAEWSGTPEPAGTVQSVNSDGTVTVRLKNYTIPGIHATVGTGTKPAQTEAITTWPLPLPRFTTDELDDVDHSKITKLDEVTLRRGKLPTVEQIAKYREVRARRTGGTVADALKESRIDCEVAQYVLDRWAGGLSDKEALWTIIAAEGVGTLASSIDRATIDERVQQARKTTLDIAEPTDNSAQRQREEREAQRQRMAALQAQLAAERAALRAEPQPEPTRFDLLECDPEANPVASIAAWEARMAQRSVQRSVRQAPVQRPQPIPQPTHRRPFEVVDAQADGLTGGAALAVLLGRAMNGGC